jgi:hypothetical protein
MGRGFVGMRPHEPKFPRPWAESREGALVLYGANTVAKSGNAPKANPCSLWGGLDVTRPGFKQGIPVRIRTCNVRAAQRLSARIRHRIYAMEHLVAGYQGDRAPVVRQAWGHASPRAGFLCTRERTEHGWCACLARRDALDITQCSRLGVCRLVDAPRPLSSGL